MKFVRVSVSGASIALLAIQLAIVSSIGGKYLYQRWTCPRVWTRTTVYDPDMLVRGRYIGIQLLLDGCRSTLPSAEQAETRKDVNGLPVGKEFTIVATQQVQFPARLKVEDNTLLAVRTPDSEDQPGGQMVTASPGTPCTEMRLDRSVDFYIGEHAAVPSASGFGQQLWVEVTVPPQGPPRPLQLALKDKGVWKSLVYQ
jgi:hypothetical protein